MLPLYVMVIAVGLVLVLLLLMCNSWFEPVIFMVNIGIAVAINLGTNVLLPGISEYTNSIVGILQLVLSMDYSIILLNRYTQEKEKCADNPSAMKAAITAAFPAVAGSSLTTFAGLLCLGFAGSSLTTFAGLLCLGFMSFKLGADMGFALASQDYSAPCIPGSVCRSLYPEKQHSNPVYAADEQRCGNRICRTAFHCDAL